MTTAGRSLVTACLALYHLVSQGAAPEAEIVSPTLRARLFLPDAQTGFYRGTRFDWSGVIGSLTFAGHEFFPTWFDRSDPEVHDFVDRGNEIVAGPCTAITGPAEEFVASGKALGFEEAKPGGTFVKIGVGVLRRPDDRPYDPFRLYPIVDSGRWTVSPRSNAVEFVQSVNDAASGYGYEYRKTVSLATDRARLLLSHHLRNTGARVIRTSVYNHNFLYLDRQPPGPEISLQFPFALRAVDGPANSLGLIQGNRIEFSRTLAGEDRVHLNLQGFGTEAKDHDIRVEHRGLGVGVRIIGDRPLSRLALWSIRAPVSIEPFVDLAVPAGAETEWQIRYEFYELKHDSR